MPLPFFNGFIFKCNHGAQGNNNNNINNSNLQCFKKRGERKSENWNVITIKFICTAMYEP